MKKNLKLILIVASTALITALVTSYFSVKNTRAAIINTMIEMEAFNEVHRIKRWDSLEQFLSKGCNKEALEYVRIEQTMGLSSLKYKLKRGIRLNNSFGKVDSSVLSRINSVKSQGKYYIPTCNKP